MADVTLTYKGQSILELSESGNKTIKTAGKYCEDNISLAYVKSGGGGSGYNILKGSSPPSVGIGQDGDVYLQYFELPNEYQRVEYLDFTPSIGIIITLPTEGYVLYDADGLSTKESGDISDLFGYRLNNTNEKDFECGFATNGKIQSYIRNPGNDNGTALFNNSSYTVGERAHAYILLKSPRSTAMIGKYATYSTSGVDDLAFKGKFYSLRGTNIISNQTVAWFVPCYRKSDNQVGVYDHVAQAFYYETYHVGSSYSITAGPDVSNTQDGIVSSFVKVNGAWQALVGSDVSDVMDSGMYTGIQDPPPASLGSDGDYYYQRNNWTRSIQSVNKSSLEGSNTKAYGNEFTVTEPLTVKSLFAMTKESRTGKLQIGTTSEILAETESVTFPANEWVEVQLQSPIQLTPGTHYVVKVAIDNNYSYGRIAYVWNTPQAVIFDSKISHVQARQGTSWPGTTESPNRAVVGFSYLTSDGVYKIYNQYHKESGSWSEIT